MANRKMTFSNTKTASSVLKQLGVSAAMLMASANAGALGLGTLEVQSNLDQPLNGTIELRTTASDDVSSVSAKIAPREDFEALGIDYPSYLENLSLVVENTSAGRVLRVRSNDVVIKEPFIHFLIRVDWSGGSFLREYTALIDPPIYASEAPRSVAQPRAVGTDQSYQNEDSSGIEVESLDDTESYDDVATTEEPEPEVSVAVDEATTSDESGEEEPLIEDDFYEEPAESTSAPDTVSDGVADADRAVYGPVASGESLSLIAQELQRQVPDLSIYSIMQILFQENPEAFINSNINGLIEGSTLDIGDLNAIRAVDAAQAKEFFKAQVEEWDPSVLASSSSNEGISVGQDEYSFTDDTFSDTGSTTSGSAENFQVGASTDTSEFVSSDQGASQAGEVLALRQEISQLETTLASTELENRELTERISLLEGQLADMNRLQSLSVENADLAVVEQALADQAEAASDNADEFATDTAEAGSDTSALDEFLAENTDDTSSIDEFLTDSDASTDTADEFLIDETDTADAGDSTLDDFLSDTGEDIESGASDLAAETDSAIESVIEDVSDDAESDVAVTPAPAVVESESFMDKVKSVLFDGGLWKILAGVGALLLAGLGILFLRRRRVDEEFEISMLSIESNSQSLDSTQSESHSHSASISASVASVAETVADKETSFLTVYSDSDAVVQADEVDPVAEADVYIAYGRDEQAEEVLLDGIASHPDRYDIKHKLLGLYQKTGNVEGFERVAEELYSQRESLTPEMWEEVTTMGKEVSPDNPLFTLSVDDISVAANSSMSIDADDAASDDSDNELEALDIGDVETDGSDDDNNDIEGHSEMVESSLNDDDSIELINFDDGRSEVSELDEVEIDALELDTEDSSADNDVIEFTDSSLEKNETAKPSDATVEIDLADDDPEELLSFDDADDEEQSVRDVQEVSDLEIDPDYDEARTQYELAKVFVDLGDEDGARKILNELVANDDNDESVKSDAQKLLESINS